MESGARRVPSATTLSDVNSQRLDLLSQSIMARFNSTPSLLLLVLLAVGHAADPDTNRTQSVIFSPQPAARTRAVPSQPSAEATSNNEDAFDFFNLVSKFLPIYPGISHECRLDSMAVLQAVKDMEPWALKMIDSSAKIPAGILRGNIKSLGHFDECIAVTSHGKRSFIGQYCLANIDVRATDENLDRMIDVATLGRRYMEITHNRTHMPVPDLLPSMALVQYAACMPSSCKPEDVRIALTEAMQWMLKSSGLKVAVQVFPESCTTREALPWKPYSIGDIIMLMVIFIFLLLVFLSTTYDMAGLNYVESESPVGKALISFSLPKNWTKLFSEDVVLPGVIVALDGVRVFSTLWVIMTHKILFFAQEPWLNKGDLVEALSNIAKMPLINTLLNVDTFLLISGLLKAYHFLRDLEHKRFSFFSCYTRRYLRLTPAYLVVMGFYATLMVRLGSGPAWNKVMEQPAEACRQNWFYNLIYLNNYINNDNQCMVQTWYLAMDFQLCLLAPLIVYPLWKWPNVGKFIFGSVGLISIAIPFLTIYCTRALPTYLIGQSDYDIKWYMQNIYFITHQRASPYIVGLALGYVFYKLNTTKVKLAKLTVAAGWALCLTTLYAVVFGAFDLVQFNHSYDPLEAAMYGGLHRTAWALAVGWLVFACNTGYGGWITRLLSARFFQCLSKLSYSIFLTHYLVLMVHSGRIRSPLFVDEYLLFHQFLADVLVTIVISLMLYLCVEAPLFELVRIMYSKKKPTKRVSSPATKNELDAVQVVKSEMHRSPKVPSLPERS